MILSDSLQVAGYTVSQQDFTTEIWYKGTKVLQRSSHIAEQVLPKLTQDHYDLILVGKAAIKDDRSYKRESEIQGLKV